MDQNEHRKEDEFAGRITMLLMQVERGKQKQFRDKEKTHMAVHRKDCR